MIRDFIPSPSEIKGKISSFSGDAKARGTDSEVFAYTSQRLVFLGFLELLANRGLVDFYKTSNVNGRNGSRLSS